MAPIRKMTSGFSSLLSRGTSYLTGTRQDGSEFSTAPAGSLFEKVDPSVDGEECLHDCDTCTIKYPAKFSIDEEAKLYGHIKGWATHLLVATGKTDWVRDVADEKGSVMEAVEKNAPPKNGVSFRSCFSPGKEAILTCAHSDSCSLPPIYLFLTTTPIHTPSQPALYSSLPLPGSKDLHRTQSPSS